jgi:superfamily II RNA helicase
MSLLNICTAPFPVKSEYEAHFNIYAPLDLSDFQKWAVKGIVDGDNVLITAHTGSGKTLPAEFAIQHFHKQGKKVIYASPIKALSNQKLYDMRKKYPHISFGLLTGDCKDNPEADVLIMTTEILRNTLFNMQMHKSVPTLALASEPILAPATEPKLALASEPTLAPVPLSFTIDIDNDLAAVVFDEVHYINDVERGSVWEQAILLLPPQVQLIMLSATIDRPEDFAAWIATEKEQQALAVNKSLAAKQAVAAKQALAVNQAVAAKQAVKKMYVASTHERVVPLSHYMWLSVHSGTIKKAAKTPYEKKLEEINNQPILIVNEKGGFNELNLHKVKEVLSYNTKNNVYVKRQFVLDSLVRYLKLHDMLPAICFIFSRKNVEQAAKECSFGLFEEDSGIPALIEKECHRLLMQKLTNYKEYIELPEYKEIVKLLEKGIAIHHAGIMPVLREMIELHFEKGYIKLLFATETFAVGINMPTKTVIFTGLTKYNGSTMRLLFPHEYTQMAGRAGRRGIDTVGHVFHCNNLFELPATVDYKNMLTGPPPRLTSKFKISFNLALNIYSTSQNILEHFTNKSLLSTDIKNELLLYIREKEQLVQALEQKKYHLALCRTSQEVLQKYKTLESQLQTTANSARKKIRIEMNTLEAEHNFLLADLKFLDAYQAVEKELAINEDTQENNRSYIKNIIQCVDSILLENGFLSETNSVLSVTNSVLSETNSVLSETNSVLSETNSVLSETNKITEKGRIAAQLQEIHCLVMADAYVDTNGFAELTAIEIATVFACFNNIHVSEEFKSHKPSTNNPLVDKTSLFLLNKLEYYFDLETKNLVDSGTAYEINFDIQPYLLDWCASQTELECKNVIQNIKHQKGVFLGEFIKAILKINNICAEFEKICEMTGNLTLLQKIKQIPSYTLKYVVTNQSLYI